MRSKRNTVRFLIISFLAFSCADRKRPEPPITEPVVDLSTPYKALTEIEIEENLRSFGQVVQGDTVELVFMLKNTGLNTLIIDEVSVDCSCMRPEYTKMITPGNLGSIRVKFLTSNYEGKIKKHLVVKSNIDGRFSKLSFMGEIVK